MHGSHLPIGCPHGDAEGLRHRDRVRHHRARGREQPGHGLVAADQRVRRRTTRPHGRSAGTSRTSSPGNDARGLRLDDSLAPEVETHLVNAVLTNGARYYVDHAHPEISHARVRRPRSRSCVCDRAAEEIVRASMVARPLAAARRRRDRRLQEQLRRQGQQLRLPRELPAGPRACRSAASSPRSRRTSSPARCSAAPARSAASCPACPHDDVPFQLSQRADFFEEEVGLETTLKRPIVNTRDEPHCRRRRSTGACT